jgi:hypothetical protein
VVDNKDHKQEAQDKYSQLQQKEYLEGARRYLHQVRRLEKIENEVLQDNPDIEKIQKILYGNWNGEIR